MCQNPGLGSCHCSLTCCYESAAESMGKKACLGSALGCLLLVLQGESGLEGDSGPLGPDGVKVNLPLVASQLSQASRCSQAPVSPGDR